MFSLQAPSMVKAVPRAIRRFLKGAAGQGMIEYALLLMLIGTVVLVILIVLGNQVHNVFNNVSCGIGKLGASCSTDH